MKFPLAALALRSAHPHAERVCVTVGFASVGLEGAFGKEVGASHVAREGGRGRRRNGRGMEDGFVGRP